VIVPDPSVSVVAQVIQLAVAPVFLLTGVGATLGVLANRLARVIDRARALEARREAGQGDPTAITEELHNLSERGRLVYRAIALLVLAALLVGFVIISLFVGVFFEVELGGVIAALFVAAMLAFIAALMVFLREVFVGTQGLRIG
jgi:amino acid transporter